nr:hypothetical protein [uncultured Roseateles sp.]
MANTQTHLFASLALALATMNVSAAPIEGTYVRVPATRFESGTLTISKLHRAEFTLDLQATFNPTGDPEQSSQFAILENEIVPIQGDVAVYRPQQGEYDPGQCTIVLTFSRPKQVQVTQFGECSSFGYRAYATGRYVRGASENVRK